MSDEEADVPAHARLGASGAHRWMNCAAAPRLEDGMDDTTSEAAIEGTLAHEDSEKILKGKMELTDSEYEVEEYIEFVKEHAATGELHVEEKLAYTEWVKDGFGTSDASIISPNDFHIIDLKYGKGIRVDAENNPQLKLYALGALQRWYFLHQPDTVTMSIVQPRLDHVSTETIDVESLLSWGEVARAKAIMTADPNAKATPGATQCQWCKAKGICRERAIYSLSIPDRDTLTPFEIGDIIPFAEEVGSWSKQFIANADQMAKNGTAIPGYKLVEGRSKRQWNDEAETILKEHVKDCDNIKDSEQLYKKELLGITAIEKLLGKGAKKITASCATKPKGKLTLVPLTDKRPEVMPDIVDFPIGD